ncbi:leukocyte-associated immunoglobulin-like receptor 1 isoform X2 [Elephas maximus indicus]|uniref:leukocyte-associated immunoglobulin-like receptor 1 isoform X2 n=1 Tax=Elephas maximus indicus TaxID=99487 RepID=UPI002116CEE8|nr:leukocyte-associated immunoglobulin-like receptor 1 isoform X2 [Elephas maximus indicus]
MSLMPTAFLGLRNLPRPSTSAEPGSVIPWRMSVTFVCQGPPGAEVFRLEKNGVPSDINPSPTEACFQTELHGEKLCLSGPGGCDLVNAGGDSGRSLAQQMQIPTWPYGMETRWCQSEVLDSWSRMETRWHP